MKKKTKLLIGTALICPLLLALILVVALVVVPHFTNKFRIDVVDDISLGASKEEVRTKLGDPYLEEKTRWGYGDKKLCSYLEDAQEISTAMEEAILRGDLERVERLNRQYENLMDEVASKKFSYIEVNFEDDAVVSVLLDKAYALEPGFKKVKEDKLTYTGNGSRFYIPYYEDHTQGKSVMRPLECVVHEELTYYNGKDFSCSTTFTDGSYYQAYVKSFSVEDRYIVWTDEYSNHKTYKPNNFQTSVTAFGTISEDGVWHSNVCFKSITIPDSVTSIGDYAFANCSGLTSITIPDSVTSIGDYAFSGCSGLTGITIPNGVTEIGSPAFENCSSLETVIWNAENCTKAGPYGYPIFDNCTNLKTVTFGENVKTIPARAFSGCSGLTSIVIPDSVTLIGDYALDCSGLEKIEVAAGNPNYSSQDGILYNKAKTKFLHIPKAIKGAVTIPEGVISIGDRAFYKCSGLTSITIPDSVTSIGEWAFNRCSGLKTVYYQGTAEDWGNISIGSFNSPLTSATRYYFTEDAPTAEEWGSYDYWWHYDPVTNEPTPWVKENQ